MELTSLRLLTRTSAVDRLDVPPTFTAAMGYEMTACLVRDLDVSLGGLILGVCVVALTGAVTSFLSLLDIEFSSHLEGTLYLYITHLLQCCQ